MLAYEREMVVVRSSDFECVRRMKREIMKGTARFALPLRVSHTSHALDLPLMVSMITQASKSSMSDAVFQRAWLKKRNTSLRLFQPTRTRKAGGPPQPSSRWRETGA